MKKALIVGLNHYPNSPLHGCIQDAIKIDMLLEKHADGSPNFSSRLITDEEPGSVRKATLRKAIEELFNGPSDTALFYFSGHGFIKSTGGYIVTPDYERYDEGISMNDILILANKSEAKDKIIILDCCHSGAFGNFDSDGSSSGPLSEGLTILTASRSSESAMEINGSGLFTSLLVDGLQGGAADLRGFITPGNLYAYVDQVLGPWDQRPIFKTNVSKFNSIRNIAPPIPFNVLRKITDYFEIPETEYQLDPSYEFTNKHAMPKHVEIFQNLQKFASNGLIVPVDADFMYYAAINSKSCKLTALGYHYWRLVDNNRI